MQVLLDAAVTLANGAGVLFGVVADPFLALAAVLALSFAWLSQLEIDEVDRQTMKPEVGRGM